MIGIYIRIEVDGKRTFRATLEVPGEHEYCLKSTCGRVGMHLGALPRFSLLPRLRYHFDQNGSSFRWIAHFS
jgi:hypothetical protein